MGRFNNVSAIALPDMLDLVDEYAEEALASTSGCGGTPQATENIMDPLIEIQKHTRQSLTNSPNHFNLIMIADAELGEDVTRDENKGNEVWEESNGSYNSGWEAINENEFQGPWRKMLRKLYNPEGRRQNQVSSDPNREYLFDYVRVAPLLVYLDLELENIEEEKERIEKEKDHQRKLNDYTSWTRTFFDGDCCAEFAWMGPQNSSARCGESCNLSKDESPVFAVIPGTKECWTEDEVEEKKCIDFKKIIATKLGTVPSVFYEWIKTNPYKPETNSKEDKKKAQEENAMYWMINAGLVTCNKIDIARDSRFLNTAFSL